MTRTALCIGINDYPGTGSDLAGCVNDAEDWRRAFDDLGFDRTTLMLDSEATRAAMMEQMTAIVSGTQAGDLAVITYSGHGTWQADDDGDEPDMRDEALCPYDYPTAGPLLDDDLFDIFAKQHRDARVVFLSDSCHSGSVARLAPALAADSGANRVRFLPPGPFLTGTALERAKKAEKAPPKGLMRGTALLISGCKDTEYSYDASFGGRPNGAFTRAALDTLPKFVTGGGTYVDWHKAIREILPSASHPQTPQLMASRTQRGWPVFG